MNLILYHGTSGINAQKIEKSGCFLPNQKANWKVTGKRNFVYLSSAYAPFYAMCATGGLGKGALIKCRVNAEKLFPEDDFIMYVLNKPVYTQKDIDKVNLKAVQFLAPLSLKYMGNVCALPEDVEILGIKTFDIKNLILICDPVISPLNFKLMGEYYSRLTKWIFEGNEPLEFEKEIKCELKIKK